MSTALIARPTVHNSYGAQMFQVLLFYHDEVCMFNHSLNGEDIMFNDFS